MFNNKVKKAKHLSKWQWFMSKVRKLRMSLEKRALEYLMYRYPNDSEQHISNIRLIETKKIDDELADIVIERQDGTIYTVNTEAITEKLKREL
jgi:DNA polymerase III delta subunit